MVEDSEEGWRYDGGTPNKEGATTEWQKQNAGITDGRHGSDGATTLTL